MQLIRKVFWDCICIDTNLPRFEALAYVLPHLNALTHVVIRVSSAEVCYSVFIFIFVKRTYLRVCYRSVLNESSKPFIFQKFGESLHPE